MEDLILVTECTLVTLWTAAAFIGRSGTAKFALVPPSQDLSGQSFEVSNFEGDVAHGPCVFCSFRLSSLLSFLFGRIKRVINSVHRISASLSRASEQSVSYSGQDPSGLQQNTFLTTLTTSVRLR